MKFNELESLIKINIMEGNTPMLIGEPGIGKSSWVEDFAEKINTKCFILPCNQLADRADLTGIRLTPVKNKDGEESFEQTFYPHSVIREAIDYAKENENQTPILFLDEINRTSSDITSSLLSLTTLRKIGNFKLPDNLKIITAGNDKGNVISLDDASITRFILYKVEADLETFLKVNNNINYYIRRVLENNKDLLYCKPIDGLFDTLENKDENLEDEEIKIEDFSSMEDDDMMSTRQITTPRTLVSLSHLLNNIEIEKLYYEGSLKEIIIAHVGETEFAVKLIAEIDKGIQQNNTNMSIDKPEFLDEFNEIINTSDDLNQLEQRLNQIDSNIIQELLVYLLTNEADYDDVIVRTLATMISELNNINIKRLIKYIENNKIEKSKIKAIRDTELSNKYNVIFNLE